MGAVRPSSPGIATRSWENALSKVKSEHTIMQIFRNLDIVVGNNSIVMHKDNDFYDSRAIHLEYYLYIC